MGQVADRLWPGETFICLATGPSLCAEDVNACRGHGRILAVNDAYRLAPWADVLYAADLPWWDAHPVAAKLPALKFAGRPSRAKPRKGYEHLTVLHTTGPHGLELDPSGLRSGGGNSGYQAVNLAVHLGAARIILLGYDMQRTGKLAHFFGSHPASLGDPPAYRWLPWRAAFATLVKPLATQGIPIVNCTRETALTCFPRMTLSQALHRAA